MRNPPYNGRYTKKKLDHQTFLKIIQCVYGPRTLFINI